MDKIGKIICEDCGEVLLLLGSMDKEDKYFGSIGEASKEIVCKNCGVKYIRIDESGKNGSPGKSSYKKK